MPRFPCRTKNTTSRDPYTPPGLSNECDITSCKCDITSCECGITSFVKRTKSAQQLRDSTVVARRVQSVTAPSSCVTHECHSPWLRSPQLRKFPLVWMAGVAGVSCTSCCGSCIFLQASTSERCFWTLEIMVFQNGDVCRAACLQNEIARLKTKHCTKTTRNVSETFEQRHLYAKKAKTEVRHICLKHLKNEMHA